LQVGGELANPNNKGMICQSCWASCLSANLRKISYCGYCSHGWPWEPEGI